MLRRLLVLALAIGVVGLPAGPAAADSCSLNGDLYPGDSLAKHCTISGVSTDAIFYIHVDQSSITVRDGSNPPQVVTGTDRDTYIGFFRYSMSTERFVTTKNGVGAPDIDVARIPYPNYKPVCMMRPLTEVNSVQNGCTIGRVRKVGTQFDSRSFEVTLHMLDDGEDQTEFAGWSLSYSEVISGCPSQQNCPHQTRTPLDEV